jgi:HK97 family phage portal protein
MGIISNLRENRSGLSKPSRWLVDALTGGSQSHTGKNVTQNTAMSLTAVYACVRILSETVASLPLPVYKRLQPRGKERAPDLYLYSVLHDMANEEMTSFTYRETAMNHLLLWGNSYSYIERDGGGRVRGLWPLLPDVTWPERRGGKLIYHTSLPNGQQKVLDESLVLHVPGMGYDGLVGYNPLQLAREAIGMGLAAEEYGARFFGNGAKPGGVLEHPNNLGDPGHKRLKKDWEDMHQGLSKSHRVAILEEGMTYKQIGVPPEEAQFLETRKFQVTEIARFFRVPPHMLADLERATFSNIEQQSIDFVTHSIRPWLVRWEQAINTKLLGREGSKRYFAEFVVEGLLRGDTKSRYDAYAVARQNGWMSANDIRELENQNPIDNGDMYLVPLNMVPAVSVGSMDEPPANPEEGRSLEKRTVETRQKQAVEIRRRITQSYQRVFEQNFSRIVKREEADVMRQYKKQVSQRSLETFNMWLSDFYREHEEFMRKQLYPTYLAVAEAMHREAAGEVGGSEEMPEDRKQFVDDYLVLLIRRHTGRSVNLIRETLDKVEEGQEEALQAEFDRWQEERVQDEARDENVRSAGAFTKAAFIGLGVRKLRWVASGRNCPYCDSLDGKVVAIESNFVRQGDEITPEGKDSFKPSGNISHAPLHSGCDCGIVAQIT